MSNSEREHTHQGDMAFNASDDLWTALPPPLYFNFNEDISAMGTINTTSNGMGTFDQWQDAAIGNGAIASGECQLPAADSHMTDGHTDVHQTGYEYMSQNLR